MSALKIKPQLKLEMYELTKSERALWKYLFRDVFCSKTSNFDVDR